MTTNDPLSNVLSSILNAEKRGKRECTVKPYSKLIMSVLNIMKSNQYIEDANLASNARGGSILVKLNRNINECGVVKPRFSFTKKKGFLYCVTASHNTKKPLYATCSTSLQAELNARRSFGAHYELPAIRGKSVTGA